MLRYLKLRRHRVRKPRQVLREARRADLKPAYALAMLEKETGIPQRNIFGCDPGAPFCHEAVTAERVHALLVSKYSNGVGWTQLTWKPFLIEAQKLGGAHKPKYQMRVGFKVLADLIAVHGPKAGFAAYNGSGPAAERYGQEAMALARKWERRL